MTEVRLFCSCNVPLPGNSVASTAANGEAIGREAAVQASRAVLGLSFRSACVSQHQHQAALHNYMFASQRIRVKKNEHPLKM